MTYSPTHLSSSGQFRHLIRSQGQSIEVREDETLRWITFGDQSIQSMMELSRPSVPVLPYTANMMIGLLMNPNAKRFLNLGIGSGSVERFLVTAVADAEITTVDINPEMVTVARDHFGLPDCIDIHIQSADDYLKANGKLFDIIFGDIFCAGDNVDLIYKDSLYRDIRRSLSDKGIFILNYLRYELDELTQVLKLLRRHFSTVAVLGVKDHRNITIYASCENELPQADLIPAAKKLHALTQLDLLKSSSDLEWLPEKND